MKKVLVVALSMVLILSSVNQEVSAKEDKNQSISLFENYETYFEEMTELENFVEIIDGKYVLNLTQEIKSTFSKDSLAYAKNHVKLLNKIIKDNNVKNVTKAGGFSIEISDAEINKAYESSNFDIGISIVETSSIVTRSSSTPLTSGGITKLDFIWGGIDIWLSSTATRNVCLFGAGALIAAVGVAIGVYSVAVIIAGGVGMIAGDLVAGVDYPPCVYRYKPVLIDYVTYQTSGGGHGVFIPLSGTGV